MAQVVPMLTAAYEQATSVVDTGTDIIRRLGLNNTHNRGRHPRRVHRSVLRAGDPAANRRYRTVSRAHRAARFRRGRAAHVRRWQASRATAGRTNNSMPRPRRRRRGRYARKYARRSSAFRRFRRRRRGLRKIVRRRLPLYPGGFPRTHKIRLRAMNQMTITPIQQQWGFIRFRPASMLNPVFGFGPQDLVAYAPHAKMKFYDKVNALPTTATINQPYGYDDWLSSGNQYGRYVVLGSKTSITITPNNVDSTGQSNWLAGWAKGTYGSSVTEGQLFATAFASIAATEVVDMLNTGICKKLRICANERTRVGLGQTFTKSYSMKKWMRSKFRQGEASRPDTHEMFGTHGVAPTSHPTHYFIMADIGDVSVAPVFSVLVITEYTLQLSNANLGDASHEA